MIFPLLFVLIGGLTEPKSLAFKNLLISGEFHHFLNHLATVHINHSCTVIAFICPDFISIACRRIEFTLMQAEARSRRPLILLLVVTRENGCLMKLNVLVHVFLIRQSLLTALPGLKLMRINRRRKRCRGGLSEIRSYQVANQPVASFPPVPRLPDHRTGAHIHHEVRGHGFSLLCDYGRAVLLQLLLVVVD